MVPTWHWLAKSWAFDENDAATLFSIIYQEYAWHNTYQSRRKDGSERMQGHPKILSFQPSDRIR